MADVTNVVCSMAIAGWYLVLKVDDEIIGETTSVNLKVKAKKLNTTTQESGLNNALIAGKVKIALSGTFLKYDDWDTLYSKLNNDVTIQLYSDEDRILNGFGKIKRLTKRGGNSDQKVSGAYGIQYKSDTSGAGLYITTEGDVAITTEGGETILA